MIVIGHDCYPVILIWKNLAASDDLTLQHQFVLIGYAITYDIRNGNVAWDSQRMIGASYKAINKYILSYARRSGAIQLLRMLVRPIILF